MLTPQVDVVIDQARSSAHGRPLRVLIAGPRPNVLETVGPPVFVHHLMEGLRRRREIEVARVQFVDARETNIDGVDERTLSLADPRFLRTIFAVAKAKQDFLAFVRGFEPDIFDLHLPERGGLLRGVRQPTVVTVHGILPEQLSHGLLPSSRALIAPLYLRAWKQGVASASAAICLSRHDADYVATNFRIPSHVMGVPRDKAFFGEKRAVPGTVLAVGALNPRKGYMDLLRAAAIVRERVPNFQLRIAGGHSQKGDRLYEVQLRRVIDQLNLSSCTTLLGRVDHLALPEELARAQVFVHLAHQESMPGAIVEALASATPVVSYDIPSSREAIRHGETGFLVPRGDIDQVAGRIVELIEHPEKSMAMGRAAQVFANSHFSIDAVARTYSQILHDVAAAIRV